MKIKLFAAIVIAALTCQMSFAINSVEKSLPINGVEKKISLVESKTLTKTEAKAIQKLERKEARSQKRLAIVQKLMMKNASKKAVDFKDPVNKWLWFGVFGWGAAFVLWILAAALVTGGGFLGGGVLGLLASLVGLFGTVSFVIWLVKKFGDA